MKQKDFNRSRKILGYTEYFLMKTKRNKHAGRVKFYADENVDLALINALKQFHHVNIKTAYELGHVRRDDLFHFRESARVKRFLLTSDRDYLNHSRFPLNQTYGIVILNALSGALDIGYFSLCLTKHIIPSKNEIERTKIVVYRDHLEIYYLDETGKVVKQVLPLN